MLTPSQIDRAIGTMLGMAVGDALGAAGVDGQHVNGLPAARGACCWRRSSRRGIPRPGGYGASAIRAGYRTAISGWPGVGADDLVAKVEAIVLNCD